MPQKKLWYKKFIHKKYILHVSDAHLKLQGQGQPLIKKTVNNVSIIMNIII